MIQDARGDTPLHAAACNGAVECLLLLLQYGIDPRLINTAGLTAADLAGANDHKKCKEMLLEYYLHYCTGSEFDSVLFLSTLQGYRVVSSEVAAPTTAMGSKSLEKKQSMFSMRNNAALRLQRWGAWIAYIDEQLSGETTYWFNPETGVGQWAVPPQVSIMRANMEQHDTFGKVC